MALDIDRRSSRQSSVGCTRCRPDLGHCESAAQAPMTNAALRVGDKRRCGSARFLGTSQWGTCRPSGRRHMRHSRSTGRVVSWIPRASCPMRLVWTSTSGQPNVRCRTWKRLPSGASMLPPGRGTQSPASPRSRSQGRWGECRMTVQRGAPSGARVFLLVAHVTDPPRCRSRGQCRRCHPRIVDNRAKGAAGEVERSDKATTLISNVTYARAPISCAMRFLDVAAQDRLFASVSKSQAM